MKNFQAIIPAPGDPYMALGRSQTGTLYRKHILNEGTLLHPVTGEPINIDSQFLDTMVTNFTDGICDIVQVPLANSLNEHDESPDRNVGEVIGLEHEGTKLYALVDARRADVADQFGKTLLGASAFLHTNYTDTSTGKEVGPTLLHVAVTNRPYVTGLEDYKELIAASADNDGQTVLLTAGPSKEPTEMPMTKDEMIASLKTEHGIDVGALQLTAVAKTPAATGDTVDAAAIGNAVLALSAAGINVGGVTPAAGATAAEIGEAVTLDDTVDAIAELAQNHVALTNQMKSMGASLTELHGDKAASEVDSLIREGRIIPAQREVMVEMALSNRSMFDRLVPENAIIPLSQEAGTSGAEEREPEGGVAAALARYTDPENGLAVQGGYIRATNPNAPRRRQRAAI